MNGFITYCLFGIGNSNTGPGPAESNKWAVKWIEQFSNTNDARQRVTENFAELKAWALTEPPQVGQWPAALPKPTGSGKWGAPDHGGDLALLRGAVLAWLNLPAGRRGQWAWRESEF